MLAHGVSWTLTFRINKFSIIPMPALLAGRAGHPDPKPGKNWPEKADRDGKQERPVWPAWMMGVKAALPEGVVPAGLTEDQAAEFCGGLSKNFFRSLVDSGHMPQPRVIRRRKVYLTDELRAALKTLPRPGEPTKEKESALADWD